MIILIQLLDAVPLPVVLLAIICATVIALVTLMLCARFPELGTTIAEIIYAWRTSRGSGYRPRRPRFHRPARRGKRGKGR